MVSQGDRVAPRSVQERQSCGKEQHSGRPALIFIPSRSASRVAVTRDRHPPTSERHGLDMADSLL